MSSDGLPSVSTSAYTDVINSYIVTNQSDITAKTATTSSLDVMSQFALGDKNVYPMVGNSKYPISGSTTTNYASIIAQYNDAEGNGARIKSGYYVQGWQKVTAFGGYHNHTFTTSSQSVTTTSSQSTTTTSSQSTSTTSSESRTATDSTQPTFTGGVGYTSVPKDYSNPYKDSDYTGYRGGVSDGAAASTVQAHNNMPPYLVRYCWERTQ